MVVIIAHRMPRLPASRGEPCRMDLTLCETQRQMRATIRRFVDAEVIPVASDLERVDQYPVDIVNMMAELGLFGILISEAYGGLGLDAVTSALVAEELSRGWMSLAGVIDSHLMLAHKIWNVGTEDQRQRYLPPPAKAGLLWRPILKWPAS
jgi:alkylation response protein AidB-like acyl-CoA dehydrogenase